MIEPEVDRLIVERRFEEAARTTRDDATLRDLLELGLQWGRYRLVRDLRERLPGVVSDDKWIQFLYDRALPAVPWRRDGAVVCVDRGVLGAIAEDLGVPLEMAAQHAALGLMEPETRNLGKLLDLSLLAESKWLVTWTRARLAQRERRSRATLDARVQVHLRARGATAITVLQTGDVDEDDPLAAWVWLVERGARKHVVKEHLGHPTNWSRRDGRNEEPGLLATVQHPNLVRLVKRGAVDGNDCLVLGYVPDARPPGRGDALHVARDVAGALAALHASGVVVLDVKPDNVLWDGRRGVLIDLGFAQRVSADELEVATLHGCARSVAPEVLRRWRGGRPVDVFQLGVALFFWLTGEHAFAEVDVPDGPDARLHYARAILYGSPRLHRLDEGHRRLVGAMLDPWPDARPTAAELCTHLMAHA